MACARARRPWVICACESITAFSIDDSSAVVETEEAATAPPSFTLVAAAAGLLKASASIPAGKQKPVTLLRADAKERSATKPVCSENGDRRTGQKKKRG